MTYEDLQPRFDALLAAELSASTVDDWVRNWAALAEDIAEESSWLFIRASSNTADQAHEKALLDFEKETLPKIKEAEQALRTKLLDSGLQPSGLNRFMRCIKSDRDLFKIENLELQAKLAALANEHGKIGGAQSVFFEGEERTMEAMRLFLQQGDRGLRERAWRAVAERVAQDKEKLDFLFDEILSLRVKISKQAGFESYTNFRFKEFWRFDYGVEDALKLHETVFEVLGPLSYKIEAWRAQALGLDKLRPWDRDVDPLGADPLRPFSDARQLYDGVKRIFGRMDAVPSENLEALWNKGLLDLASRKNKRQVGFNSPLPKSKASFIFMNAVGIQDDVMILLHEGGHAMHARLCEPLPLFFQRDVPTESAELASMSMELFGLAYLEEFYSGVDLERARLDSLLRIAKRLCSICMVDLFQHQIHAEPEMSAEKRHALYGEILDRTKSGVDWDGINHFRNQSWHSSFHVFVVPFYMIEYSFAQLGALQIWEQSLKDPRAAFAKYKAALALGGNPSLPELYRAAGAEFNPTPDRLRSMAARLEAEINMSLQRLGKSPLP